MLCQILSQKFYSLGPKQIGVTTDRNGLSKKRELLVEFYCMYFEYKLYPTWKTTFCTFVEEMKMRIKDIYKSEI